MPAHSHIVTARCPGAIAGLAVTGDGAAGVVAALIGRQPVRRAALCDLGGIDDGLVAALNDRWCLITPHGGVRVVQRLSERLAELGAPAAGSIDPRTLYPEATSDLEADMLGALAGAASPAAVDRLLNQPAAWRDVATGKRDWPDDSPALDRLIHPPRVVLIGRANVGKSTLTNRVVGRAASITADLPGTTRDWVSALAELPTPVGELAVVWHDTPGLRQSDDPLEQRAIELARRVIDSADLLIAVRDADHDWPDPLDRCDLRAWNKIDIAPPPAGFDGLAISAATGEGIDALGIAVADRLGLASIAADQPWPFSARLVQCVVQADRDALARYAGVAGR